MRLRDTPEDLATLNALRRGMLLVLAPGLLFVFVLIWLVMPPYAPPQDWANGTYVNACCTTLVLRDGVATADGQATRYLVADGKSGTQIVVKVGIRVRRGRVEFGGGQVFVEFDHPSWAPRNEAKALHLYGSDDGRDYSFVRQK
ncbi:hypothetical protein [Sphingomonas kyeonggiensis]|uniref:Uncharacterized protein n=1 Tax=Sphingomonas kyeonggiensis TaxID=1268553 RepID=A0A7W6JQ80_9SPHN|nr:hypothetical protein [Sphingomonas kyeonggiensis]MBB4097526.1 hypothetical protein [Sphingomonas kyeonggiensis]